MKLTVLGSGLTTTPRDMPYRYPAAHLLEVSGKKILLDTGVGVLPQLGALNLQITDIDIICVSHFHADHFNLSPILQALYSAGRASSKKPFLQIVGPPTIETRVREEYAAKGWVYEADLLQYTGVAFSDYASGQTLVFDDIRITPYKTKHFNMDAYALRIESEGKVLAYSGDTSVNSALATAAKNADLFLCEAGIDIGKPDNEGHISAYQAGEAARQAQAKHLCLVHYSGTDTNKAMIEEVERSGYLGEVSIADDLSVYEIA